MRSVAVLIGTAFPVIAHASTPVVCSSVPCRDLVPATPAATCAPDSGNLGRHAQSQEWQYAEVALHYHDGTKDVVSATGLNPHCSYFPPSHHQVFSSRAKGDYPYKATWTRVHYVAPSPGESLCVDRPDILSEKIDTINIQVLPSDAPLGAGTGAPVHGTVRSEIEPTSIERSAGQKGTNERMGEEVGYVPQRRRATLGELCQLLALFVVLGALHYVSSRWAARWQAPPPMERVEPHCE